MRKKPKRKFYRLNLNISAPKVRVVDQKGKQIGIFLRQKALELAREKEVDLVEIAPRAYPPVCKLIDFRKFLYLEKKRERREKKGSKARGIKEIRLRPFIGDHDYRFRLDQAREFLKEGNKLRIRVPFFGREIAKKKFGFEIFNRLLKDLGEGVQVEREARFIGKTLVAQMALIKKYDQKKEKQTKSENEKGGSEKV